MRTKILLYALLASIEFACKKDKNHDPFESRLNELDLKRGDIALCGSANGQFGTVAFSLSCAEKARPNFNLLSCAEKARPNFNLATALLHSFEYTEAEKVFADVIDEDPGCIMAYWGAAMCNFHPLWEIPSEQDLQKGSRIIALARSLVTDTTTRESAYLEAIAAIYDDHDKLDHRTRVLKYEKASEKIFLKYPEDSEAAIFYCLSLRAAADPADKTFSNQKKAGEILDAIFAKEPNHPGIAHYIIHNYDYPELAALALPAARKYASIAAASAHAQHMPSHIFTRLGLWEEDIQSNLNSVSAATCYAQNLGIESHWDEELHGMDYLVYAYLQQANDTLAREQIEYLKSINDVFPQNFKVAYAFAAIPVRYALERKDWIAASELEPGHPNFPWEKFPWEKANMNFGKLLGEVHTRQLPAARTELEKLKAIQKDLSEAKEMYKANLVMIQVKAAEGWINLAEGRKEDALALMSDAADMEDLTEKHPVTPGEVIPARELLADMYMEIGDSRKALEAYEADLRKHPNRFNGLYGAGLAADRTNNRQKAIQYFEQLALVAGSSNSKRTELLFVKAFLKKNS